MPSFDLVTQDPLVGTNFFLEIAGEVISNLTSVDGLSLEIEKADVTQRIAKGTFVQHTTMSKPKWTGELTIKRLAPLDSSKDPMWTWFMKLRNSGMSAATRSTERKSGSIVIYDSTMTEVSRWNFTNAWPSKIDNDGLDVTKNDPVGESITIQYEQLTRIK
jgi:phage tail-like protein